MYRPINNVARSGEGEFKCRREGSRESKKKKKGGGRGAAEEDRTVSCVTGRRRRRCRVPLMHSEKERDGGNFFAVGFATKVARVSGGVGRISRSAQASQRRELFRLAIEDLPSLEARTNMKFFLGCFSLKSKVSPLSLRPQNKI